jgi:branched-chain amino acid transport system substrate-binding protein
MQSATFLVFLFLPLLISSAGAETIKVGAPLPLTGVRADAGAYGRNGLLIAKTEIAQDPARRFKLEFIFEDTQYNGRLAVTAFHKLKEVDHVNYVIGAFGSSEVLAVAPLAEESKTLLITPSAQSDEISHAGDYIFRVNHNTAQEAPFFSAFVAKHMRGDTIHFLVIQTAFSPSYLKNFKPGILANGRKIGAEEEFDPATGDLRPQLTRLKAKNASDILLLSTPTHTALALKEAKELGLNARFFGIAAEGPDILSAGRAAEGLFYPYSYDSESAEPRLRRFLENYKVLYGSLPDYTAPNAYDAAYILSDCLEKVGDNVSLVKDCLYQIKDYAGAGGTFSIDGNGDAVKQLIIKVVKNGEFKRYQ